MKKILAILLVLAIAVSTLPMAVAYDTDRAGDAAKAAAAAIRPDDPTLSSEWLMVADSTYSYCGFDESYRKAYYDNIKALLDANDGGLGVNRFTEYERVIIALTALGYDASDIGGHDLLKRLADYDDVKKQGINSIAFGLIALDSGCYDMPTDPEASTPNSRKKMVDNILSREIEGGGFALYGKVADVDITAMALQALARYTYRADVKTAVDRAVSELSRQQLPDGSFKHLESDTEGDYAATVQSIHAISAAARAAGNGTPAYMFNVPESTRFTDVVYNDYRAEIEALAEVGIIDGMTDTTFAPDATMTRAQFAAIVIRALGMEQKTVSVFSDVPAGAWYAGVVGAAYSAGIIQGRSDTVFDPNGTITDIEAFIMLSRAARISGVDGEEPAWYASDYNITRGEVAAAVYELYAQITD